MAIYHVPSAGHRNHCSNRRIIKCGRRTRLHGGGSGVPPHNLVSIRESYTLDVASGNGLAIEAAPPIPEHCTKSPIDRTRAKHSRCPRCSRVLGADRTKVFHVKHFGTIGHARKKFRFVGLHGAPTNRPREQKNEIGRTNFFAGMRVRVCREHEPATCRGYLRACRKRANAPSPRRRSAWDRDPRRRSHERF
jgi:hypothetical protein